MAYNGVYPFGIIATIRFSEPRGRRQALASEGYHEPVEYLENSTKDMHRAIQSTVEELEAITWYMQRIDATDDPTLQQVLAHNRDEEKEHASMLLEWIRRHDPCFDAHLRTYLFTEAPHRANQEAPEGARGADASPGAAHVETPSQPRHLTVGSLIGKR